MAEPFEFSEIQANHILDMTLSPPHPPGPVASSRRSWPSCARPSPSCEAILADPGRLRQVIKDEMGEIRTKYATPRRAEITFDPGDLDNLDLIDDEELVVTMTHAGYIKTVAADAFRTQGRGGRGVAGARLRDNDYVARIVHTTAHAYLLFFSNRGKVYRLRAHEIPMKERTARGTAIANLLPLQPGERIQAIIDTRDYETSRYLFFATKSGMVKKTRFTEYDSSRRDGLIAINLRDDDELVRVIQTNGGDDIFMVSSAGTTIRFCEDDVRATGRSAMGVIGMRLRAGRRGGVLRRHPRRRRPAHRHRHRVRQAHQARQVPPQGPGHHGRHRHPPGPGPGQRGRRPHGRPRRRDAAHLLRRRHHPHRGARHLGPGPRRHRRAGHEPRRRPDGRRRRPRPQRRRLITDRVSNLPRTTSPLLSSRAPRRGSCSHIASGVPPCRSSP